MSIGRVGPFWSEQCRTTPRGNFATELMAFGLSELDDAGRAVCLGDRWVLSQYL
jgi:hypothetical protein